MKSILSLLLLGTALMVSTTRAAPPPSGPPVDSDAGNFSGLNGHRTPIEIPQRKAKGRSASDDFTLGSKGDSDIPIYSYANTIYNDDASPDFVVEVNYPAAGGDGDNDDGVADAIITQIDSHVEGDDGMDVQAYVTSGGIGARSVSVQIVASNTESLRYVVVVYGNMMKRN